MSSPPVWGPQEPRRAVGTGEQEVADGPWHQAMAALPGGTGQPCWAELGKKRDPYEDLGTVWKGKKKEGGTLPCLVPIHSLVNLFEVLI